MGIVGLTKTTAKEWGPMGVRCNTIAFGMFLFPYLCSLLSLSLPPYVFPCSLIFSAGWIETRLTAAKEQGATIEVEGKKV